MCQQRCEKWSDRSSSGGEAEEEAALLVSPGPYHR